MTDHTIKPHFVVTAGMNRTRSDRVQDRVVEMLASTIAGPQGVDDGARILARAIYRGSLALPALLARAIQEVDDEMLTEKQHGQKEPS